MAAQKTVDGAFSRYLNAISLQLAAQTKMLRRTNKGVS
jgi:hypothetical protein